MEKFLKDIRDEVQFCVNYIKIRLEVFYKNFVKSTGKCQCWSFFLIKFLALGQQKILGILFYRTPLIAKLLVKLYKNFISREYRISSDK